MIFYQNYGQISLCVAMTLSESLVLTPSFKPPTPSSFFSLNVNERSKVILGFHFSKSSISEIENKSDFYRPISSLSEFVNPDTIPLKNDELSLFGGIVKVQPQQLKSNTTLPVGSTGRENITDASSSKAFLHSSNVAEKKAPKRKLSGGLDTRSNKKDRQLLEYPIDRNFQSKNDCSLKLEDFENIQNICYNAGSSDEGLQSLINMCASTTKIIISIIWSDFTSNHTITTQKYCTPSVKCKDWNCTCDQSIRIQQAYKPLLGAMIYIPLPSDENSKFFLPLAPCHHHNNNSKFVFKKNIIIIQSLMFIIFFNIVLLYF